MKLAEFVVEQAIVSQLKSTERDDVIKELIAALVCAGSIAKDQEKEMVAKVLEREAKGSTGFGKGVAVPHLKADGVKKMVAAIGVSQKGIDFSALDKLPVYSVVLLASPADQPDEHLQAMEIIFSNLQKDNFRRFLRQSNSKEDIVDLLREADSQQIQA